MNGTPDPGQDQIDAIEREIITALAGGRLPRFMIPIQPASVIPLWRQYVQSITGSHAVFLRRFAAQIEAASNGRVQLRRNDTPPASFRQLEGLHFELLNREGSSVLQFFVNEYPPIFRGYNR